MAKKKNTLTPFVKQLHLSLAKSNFAASASEGSAKRDRARTQQIVNAGNTHSLITMAALLGCNVYEAEPEKVAYGAGMIRGKDVVPLFEEAIAAAQVNAIENGYEAMDTFVKAVTSEFLYVKRGHVPIMQKWRQRQQSAFGKKAAKENTLQYFREVVTVLASRNCDDLFKLLFKYIDGLRNRVTSTHFGDLHEIHLAVEAMRHCTTHANGRYVPSDYISLPNSTQVIVRSCAKASVIHGDNRLLPSQNAAADLLAREAEYGQIIYDAITNELGMQLDYKPS